MMRYPGFCPGGLPVMGDRVELCLQPGPRVGVIGCVALYGMPLGSWLLHLGEYHFVRGGVWILLKGNGKISLFYLLPLVIFYNTKNLFE